MIITGISTNNRVQNLTFAFAGPLGGKFKFQSIFIDKLIY